jgi:DNA-directed RNA polymerase subunit E'
MVYRLYRVKDVVRIPPDKFNEPLEESAFEVLRKQYEGVITSNMGIIVTIIDVKVDPLGKIIMGDGATYHDVEYTVLAFNPFQKEVVEGEINTIIPQGVFVNLGAQDGFIHISQIADERIEYDPTRPGFVLKDTRRILEKGDHVRARIYAISLMRGKGLRIQMTMRQPMMGKIEWIRKEIQRKPGKK